MPHVHENTHTTHTYTHQLSHTHIIHIYTHITIHISRTYILHRHTYICTWYIYNIFKKPQLFVNSSKKKIKHTLSGGPVPQLSDVYLGEARGHIHTKTCTVFITAMFLRAPKERTSLFTSKGPNRCTNNGQLVGGSTVLPAPGPRPHNHLCRHWSSSCSCFSIGSETRHVPDTHQDD